jgi:hypothetical protein
MRETRWGECSWTRAAGSGCGEVRVAVLVLSAPLSHLVSSPSMATQPPRPRPRRGNRRQKVGRWRTCRSRRVRSGWHRHRGSPGDGARDASPTYRWTTNRRRHRRRMLSRAKVGGGSMGSGWIWCLGCFEGRREEGGGGARLGFGF